MSGTRFSIRFSDAQWDRLEQLARHCEIVHAMNGDTGDYTVAELIFDIADGTIDIWPGLPQRPAVLGRIERMLRDPDLDSEEIAERVGCSLSLVERIADYISTGPSGAMPIPAATRSRWWAS